MRCALLELGMTNLKSPASSEGFKMRFELERGESLLALAPPPLLLARLPALPAIALIMRNLHHDSAGSGVSAAIGGLDGDGINPAISGSGPLST